MKEKKKKKRKEKEKKKGERKEERIWGETKGEWELSSSQSQLNN